MRYLFLRGNRNKRFFLSIANELIDRGHECYQILFELGELLVDSGNVETVFAPRHVTGKEYPIDNETLLSMQIYNITFREKMLGKKVSARELSTYKKYMNWIDQYIEEKQIEVVCMFNGYHWIDQVTTYLAKKRGLKTYFFEDGLFRPYTVTVDPKGINANSSVPREASFYDRLEIDHTRLKTYLFAPENEHLQATKENLLKVAVIKGISMLGAFLRVHPRLYVHTTFWQSIKYFTFKYRFRYKKNDEVNLTNNYIFIPFQVSRDTQIFYNSPHIKKMEDLLEEAVKAVAVLNEKRETPLTIVVKRHPEDMSRNNYRRLKEKYASDPRVLFVQKYNTKTLIQHAELILTINSTVGIEALAQNKKVVTMGEALYNIDGVTFHVDHPSFLQDVLEKALQKEPNRERIEKFIYYLRFFYQVEGSINGTSPITAKNIANKLEEGRETS